MGRKVLMIDLDPQCNLTICGLEDEAIQKIWAEEDPFIDDFQASKDRVGVVTFEDINSRSRTIHYLLKSTEEGAGDLETLPPPVVITESLHLIPGRLSMHMFEDKIAERWNGIYRGDPLAIRTVTKIRSLAEEYSKQNNYDFIIMDTSPSLGILNKVIISTVDGFLIPCLPDMFSLYGIRNIGDYLTRWKREFDTIYSLISNEKRANFPSNFVRFLGFTIYNAKKYTNGNGSNWDLAQAHYDYAIKIPVTIEEHIQKDVREHLTGEMLKNPIGKTSIMHSHNTFPNVTQKYKQPMWNIPNLMTLEPDDISTIRGNRNQYEATKDKYISFTIDFLERINTLD